MREKTRDLSSLPRWLRYCLAAAVMGVIATAGYFVGRDKPTPVWVDQWLIPILGWLGLLLIMIVALEWIRKPR